MSAETPGGSPAPGWYPDHQDAAQLRYWDGSAWTEHVAPREQAQAATTPPVYGTPEQSAPTYGTPPAYGASSVDSNPGQQAPWEQNPATPYQQQPYQQQPYGGYGQPVQQTSNLLSIISFVFAGLSILIVPIIFGPIAIILAAFAIGRKERLSKIAIGVAVGCMIVGFILGAVVFASMRL